MVLLTKQQQEQQVCAALIFSSFGKLKKWFGQMISDFSISFFLSLSIFEHFLSIRGQIFRSFFSQLKFDRTSSSSFVVENTFSLSEGQRRRCKNFCLKFKNFGSGELKFLGISQFFQIIQVLPQAEQLSIQFRENQQCCTPRRT